MKFRGEGLHWLNRIFTWKMRFIHVMIALGAVLAAIQGVGLIRRSGAPLIPVLALTGTFFCGLTYAVCVLLAFERSLKLEERIHEQPVPIDTATLQPELRTIQRLRQTAAMMWKAGVLLMLLTLVSAMLSQPRH